MRSLLKMEHGRLIRLITRFILAVNGISARIDQLHAVVRPGPGPGQGQEPEPGPGSGRGSARSSGGEASPCGDSDSGGDSGGEEDPLGAFRSQQPQDLSWADGGFEFDDLN